MKAEIMVIISKFMLFLKKSLQNLCCGGGIFVSLSCGNKKENGHDEVRLSCTKSAIAVVVHGAVLLFASEEEGEAKCSEA